MSNSDDGVDFIAPELINGALNSTIGLIKPPERPKGAIFTTLITLKLIPISFYLLGGLIIWNNVFHWVTIIILGAIDFWFTKKIAGRLILGLMWKNVVNEDGESEWKYWHSQSILQENTSLKKYFWIFLFINCVIWPIFSFISLIRLNFGWVFVTCIMTMMSFANFVGFWNSSKAAKRESGDTGYYDDTGFISNYILPFVKKGLSKATSGFRETI